MSNIYITEPMTKGKVVLKTTLGDIDIELWSKEAPKACRQFVQLCMEHYYDSAIFHRVIRGFIMQGGDPTGTGFGGESIYPKGEMPNEFHSRLRFSHRGIVAMAHEEPENAGSQFFITLDKAPELLGKHTIFGKVAGDTIFNVLKVNDFEIDENDKPIYPPKILQTIIISNPFDDIEPRKKHSISQPVQTQKRKLKKNFNLLSFGEEAEQEEQELESVSLKIKSSYHFSEDPEERETALQVEKRKREQIMKKSNDSEQKEMSTEEIAKKTRNKLSSKKSRTIDIASKQHDFDEQRSDEVMHLETRESSKLQTLKQEQKKLKKEILSLQNKPETKKEEETKKSFVEEMRAKYLEKKKQRKPTEDMILGKLAEFKKQIQHTSPKIPTKDLSKSTKEKFDRITDIVNIDSDSDIDDNDTSWMGHKLHFEGDKKRKNEMMADDVYIQLDPLANTEGKRLSQHQRRLRGEKKTEKW